MVSLSMKGKSQKYLAKMLSTYCWTFDVHGPERYSRVDIEEIRKRLQLNIRRYADTTSPEQLTSTPSSMEASPSQVEDEYIQET